MEYCKKDCEHIDKQIDYDRCDKYHMRITKDTNGLYERCSSCEEVFLRCKSQAITGFRNQGHFANYIRKIVYSIKPDCLIHPINEMTWRVWDRQNISLMQEYVRDIKWLNLKKDLSLKEWNDHIKTLRVKYGLPEKFSNKKKWKSS